MKGRSESCCLQLFDDCRDCLDLTSLFTILHGFCEHMIVVIFVSVEDILVALGGWDKKPTGGISVHLSRCLMTGKIEVSRPLFYGKRVNACL